MLNYLQEKSDWLFPHTIAAKSSNGAWVPYPHLQYVSVKIARALARGNARLVFMMHPSSGKSEFISHWTPFWYMHLFPDNRTILASYADAVAKQWGALVRDEIQNNEISELRVATDSEAKSDWKIRGRKGSMTTCGVGGQLTSKHAELLIIDDIVKDWETASSKTIQQRNINWYKTTFHTRCEPGASIIVLGTPWHPSDLLMYLCNKDTEKWDIVRLPAFAQVNDPIGRKEGQALCPERFDEKALEIKRSVMGSFLFEALYQLNPSLPEGNLVKRSDFKRYTTLPVFSSMFMDADLTFKKTDEGSYVVIQVWGVIGDEFYLVEQFRARLGFNGQCNELNRMKSKFPMVDFIYVEDAANAQALLDTLRREVRGIKLIHVDTDKVSRFLNIQPTIENRRLNIPQGEMGDKYIDELCMFPNVDHDDQVDASSIGIGQRQHRTQLIGEIMSGTQASTFYGK